MCEAEKNDDPETKNLNEFSKKLKANKRKSIDKQMEDMSKKTFVPSVAIDKTKEVAGEIVEKITPSFLEGE